MTRKIPKHIWKEFFDKLSKRRYEWLVKIEIISKDIGDQILDEGLPLIGITAGDKRDKAVIEISVGRGPGQHQSHSVINAKEVAYLSENGDASGTVEILEYDGTKTLIHIMRPMPITIDYSRDRDIAAA